MTKIHKKISESILDFITEFESDLKSKLKDKILNKCSNIHEIRGIEEFNWYLPSEEYIDMFSSKGFEIEGDICLLVQDGVKDDNCSKRPSYSFSNSNIIFSFEKNKFVFNDDIIIE